MAHKKFDDFFDSKASKANGQIDWSQKRNLWIENLTSFYSIVEGFLAEYIASDKISVVRQAKTIDEEYIGSYNVDRLLIRIGEDSVRLDPIGTNMIGTSGRVDLIGPSGSVKFVLAKKGVSEPEAPRVSEKGAEPATSKELEWKIAKFQPTLRYFPLTADSLFDAIMEVTGG
jgi:hypothetical protein